MATPEREEAQRLCATAAMLSQSLTRELARLESGCPLASFKEMYDEVYRPRLAVLSEQANLFVESDEWRVLRAPLHPEFAETQVRIVVELLEILTMAF